MRHGRAAAFLATAFAVLVAVPVAARRGTAPVRGEGRAVIVVSPHHEQIRQEFGEAFARWHERVHGERVTVLWNTPGGASDIRRMLEAGALAALRAGRPVGGTADVVFGGGSWEFEQLKRPLSADSGGTTRTASLLEPVAFDEAWLRSIYGDGTLGGRPVVDPDGHWFGAALSSFGIVWNRELLAHAGVDEPTGWESLADPRLLGLISLSNPAQSGSVATAMEAILQHEGWGRGWAILRRAAANARTVSASGTRGPIDVSQGEAAEAICIDFYGRFQAQAIADGGSPGRLGYLDPPGRTAIEADPIALLRGAPEPELGRRFIEFTLSPEGQRLWQLPPGTPGGPRRFALRRLPVSRAVWADDRAGFVDRDDPWESARAIAGADPNVRAFVAPLFSAMAVDTRVLLRRAWEAIVRHPAYPAGGRLVTAEDVGDPALRRMLEAFDAMPVATGPHGTTVPLADAAGRAAVRDGWLRGGWSGEGLWAEAESPADALRVRWAAHFERTMRDVLAVAEEQP